MTHKVEFPWIVIQSKNSRYYSPVEFCDVALTKHFNICFENLLSDDGTIAGNLRENYAYNPRNFEKHFLACICISCFNTFHHSVNDFGLSIHLSMHALILVDILGFLRY